MHAFLEDIVLTIHPTSGEGMMEAAMNASAMRFIF
jgi:orotidine-5'-phosphate decarboxylase